MMSSKLQAMIDEANNRPDVKKSRQRVVVAKITAERN